MTYNIEHSPLHQHALVGNQFTTKWFTWKTFEDKELADKELSNLLLRFDPTTFRLTHSPD